MEFFKKLLNTTIIWNFNIEKSGLTTMRVAIHRQPYANLRDSNHVHVPLCQDNLLPLIPQKRLQKLDTVNSLVSSRIFIRFVLTAYKTKGFLKFLVDSLTLLFCMSNVHFTSGFNHNRFSLLLRLGNLKKIKFKKIVKEVTYSELNI